MCVFFTLNRCPTRRHRPGGARQDFAILENPHDGPNPLSPKRLPRPGPCIHPPPALHTLAAQTALNVTQACKHQPCPPQVNLLGPVATKRPGCVTCPPRPRLTFKKKEKSNARHHQTLVVQAALLTLWATYSIDTVRRLECHHQSTHRLWLQQRSL